MTAKSTISFLILFSWYSVTSRKVIHPGSHLCPKNGLNGKPEATVLFLKSSCCAWDNMCLPASMPEGGDLVTTMVLLLGLCCWEVLPGLLSPLFSSAPSYLTVRSRLMRLAYGSSPVLSRQDWRAQCGSQVLFRSVPV